MTSNYEKLAAVAYEMYQSLLIASSTWEDSDHSIKAYHDELKQCGVLPNDKAEECNSQQ